MGRREEGGREDGEERSRVRGRREGMERKEESRASGLGLGSGNPGFPGCFNDPDVQLQGDGCFGS